MGPWGHSVRPYVFRAPCLLAEIQRSSTPIHGKSPYEGKRLHGFRSAGCGGGRAGRGRRCLGRGEPGVTFKRGGRDGFPHSTAHARGWRAVRTGLPNGFRRGAFKGPSCGGPRSARGSGHWQMTLAGARRSPAAPVSMIGSGLKFSVFPFLIERLISNLASAAGCRAALRRAPLPRGRGRPEGGPGSRKRAKEVQDVDWRPEGIDAAGEDAAGYRDPAHGGCPGERTI